MVALDLGRADVALLADPDGTRVVIPNLVSLSTPWRDDKTFVRFAGDLHDTAWRGEGRTEWFPLSAQFARAKHDRCEALLDLLKHIAPAAPDSRLLLRTHAGLAPGLNAAAAVEVDGDVTPVWQPSMIVVSFTLRVVEHSFYA